MDFKGADSSKLRGKSDAEVLNFAAAEGRVLVTHDIRTLPRHFADLLERGGHSPGVILVPQSTPVSVAIESLVLIWAVTEPGEWADRIAKIPL
jgi:predicted nuclease of predicted toxin-antitoxin system